MRGIILRMGRKNPCVFFPAANPDLKLNAEETERRGNICGKLRAEERKNIYKKKKEQGHRMEDTENENTYRTPFCQVISKKEEDL